MSTIVEGAKRLLGKGSTGVAGRVDSLRDAVEAARGRLPDDLVGAADLIASRAAARLSLSGDHTVVALAGATGSGKSSTFNALVGMDLAAVGVRRPTTAWTMACVWGPQGAGDLLSWLGVPERHQVSRDSMLDERRDRALEGLVLLDLPDHDSTEVAHHVEVERLVRLADMMVWVLDPQKYADAAIHDRFLRPMAAHRDIMMVALNHIDSVPVDKRAVMVEDLERLMKEDGLEGVPVLTTAAVLGEGIPELKKAIARRVAAKQATASRLMADVTSVARRMQEVNGTAKPGDIARRSKNELVESFADAAGVPTVVHAVEKAAKLRASRATGWPLTKWLGRLKPDPLKRLHLDLGPSGRQLTRDARASLRQASPVQRARVDAAVRAVADNVGSELSQPWADAVHRASTSRLEDLNDALDRAVTGTDLGVSSTPLWWHAVRLLQWVLFLAAVVGGLWLGAVAVIDYLALDAPSVPDYRGFPIPTALLLGGTVLGVLIAVGSRAFAGLAAKAKARSANARLRSAIGDVTEGLVIRPIEAEVEAYRRTRHSLDEVLR